MVRFFSFQDGITILIGKLNKMKITVNHEGQFKIFLANTLLKLNVIFSNK